MTTPAETLLAALHDLVPGSDAADNAHRLNEAFAALPGAADGAVLAALFELLERHPRADFGTPGPLVQRLEPLPDYRPLLAASLARQPTELTAWMTNRLLNAALPRAERGAWLKRLAQVPTHPLADATVRQSTIGFLDFQASRSGRLA